MFYVSTSKYSAGSPITVKRWGGEFATCSAAKRRAIADVWGRTKVAEGGMYTDVPMSANAHRTREFRERQKSVIPAKAGIQVFMKQFAVYILASKCRGTLYTGVTSDLTKRAWQHKNEA